MLKKIVLFLFVAVFILSANAKGNKEEIDNLDKIKKSGKLVLGTSADYPPLEFHLLVDGKDTIVGFDIEIAKEIAKDLGVELQIKDMSFDGLLAALVSGNIDIIISGMTPTAERKKNVDFSEVYYIATHGAIIRKADEKKYAEKIESLKNVPIGAQKGSIQVGIAKEQVKGITGDALNNNHPQVKELTTIADLIMDLKGTKIEAVIAEIPVATPYVQKHPDLMIANFRFPVEEDGSAIAVKKGNENLVKAINVTLNRLKAENKINQFVADANTLTEKL